MHFCVKFTTFEFSFIFKIKCKLLKFDAVVNPGKMGSIFVTNRNLGQNHVLNKNPNFGQKTNYGQKKFSDKYHILDTNQILDKHPDFGNKNFFGQRSDFGQK